MTDGILKSDIEHARTRRAQRKEVKVRKLLVLVVLVVAALLAGVDTASADTYVIGTPATYKGRIIDVSRDWGGAKACAVLSEHDVRCYASEAEQWRDLAKLRRPVDAELLLLEDVYCLNRTDLFLILYENTSFGGSSLSLAVADVWHNLSSFSFDDITSSWKNNTYCDVTAATGTSGGGSQTTLGSRSQSSDVGSTWNDTFSSVKILAS